MVFRSHAVTTFYGDAKRRPTTSLFPRESVAALPLPHAHGRLLPIRLPPAFQDSCRQRTAAHLLQPRRFTPRFRLRQRRRTHHRHHQPIAQLDAARDGLGHQYRVVRQKVDLGQSAQQWGAVDRRADQYRSGIEIMAGPRPIALRRHPIPTPAMPHRVDAFDPFAPANSRIHRSAEGASMAVESQGRKKRCLA